MRRYFERSERARRVVGGGKGESKLGFGGKYLGRIRGGLQFFSCCSDSWVVDLLFLLLERGEREKTAGPDPIRNLDLVLFFVQVVRVAAIRRFGYATTAEQGRLVVEGEWREWDMLMRGDGDVRP